MPNLIAIRLENLSKTFGRGQKEVQAVKSVNLEIHSGQVYGFLGPNGAGKSTTIRLMMDLIRPTSGAVYLFDEKVREHPGVLKRAGALVEGASFYNHLDGRENLSVLARTANDYHPERIEALLEQVGLAGRADQQVSGYSTGMKQRLGIAAALLNDPDLVILDEPTSGLDPNGIQEMRIFIRDLAVEQGKTVFLSSHLLSEVEQICDRVAIIHQGTLLREGGVERLLQEGQVKLRVQVSPAEGAASLLSARWPVAHQNGWVTVNASPEESPLIVRQLVETHMDVHQVIVHRQSLEDFFLTVTGAENDG